MGMGIPLYVHPGVDASAWAALAVNADVVNWVVLNQNSGPGDPEDAVLGDAARGIRAAGARILGYVDLDYGNRDDFFNFQDATTWVARGFDGVFLDRAPTAVDKVQKTAATILGIRSKGIKYVVANPGTVPLDERYIQMADQSVVFEGSPAAYRAASFPAWMAKYPAERFCHLVGEVKTFEEASRTVALARTRGAGSVFVHTSPDGPDAKWTGIPSYWPQLTRLFGREHPEAAS
ncbi:spherulation-specific family 4 protein [Streptomyces sp. NPDC088752]|uniref:spherulation-specific family 4 protein n=1 Tax=Streptomyces sp. NPDC088752 TaxID=3154963 RepID=UPI003448737F